MTARADTTTRPRVAGTGEERPLPEQVKALTALHKAARLLQAGLHGPSALEVFVGLLPPAFRHPEVAVARVRLGGACATTPGFAEGLPTLGVEFRTADGAAGSLEVGYRELRGPAAEPPFLQGERALLESLAEMLRSAHERTRAEVALRRKEELFRQLVENAWDDVAIVAEDGKILYESPAILRMLGRAAEAEVGSDLLARIHPEDRARAAAFLEGIFLEGGAGRLVEYRCRHVDGSERVLESTGARMAGDRGGPVVVINTRDITERRQVEERLREAEERLCVVVNSAPIVLFATDAHGIITLSEGQGLGALGLDGGQIAGRSLFDLFGDVTLLEPAGGRGRCAEAFRRVLAGESVIGTTRTNAIWHEVKLVPVRGEQGRVDGIVGVATDITDRVEAEEALRASEARLKRAQALAQLGSYEFRAPFRKEDTRWSEETFRILGFDPAAGAPSAADCFPLIVEPADQARAQAAFEAAYQEGKPFVLEYDVRRQDGSICFVECVGAGLEDASGAIVGVMGTVHDLTFRKRAETELRRSEERYRALVEASSVMFWRTDVNGMITDDHAIWRELTGQRWEETRGHGWLDAIHPEDRPRAEQIWTEAIRSGRPYAAGYRVRMKDGRYRDFDARGVPVRDERGRVREWVGTLTDVTERKQLEQQLRQAQRMEAVGQLAGGVAHDFNNLLTVIVGYGDLVAQRLGAADVGRREIDEIRHAALRGAGLVQQLLAFSSKQVLRPEVVDLNGIVRDAGRLLLRLIGEHIDLRTNLGGDLAPVLADPVQIQQVLLNLAINARDAMPRGGTLAVTTENVVVGGELPPSGGAVDVPPGRYVRLTVADTGTGMSPEVRARSFEPFFTTKGPGQGTGLGLSTVYGIVKQSGGHIELFTEVGRGSIFHVYLPEAERPPTRAVPSVEGRAARGEETVLLVEDEDAVRALVQQLLRAQGYEVLVARDAAQALRMVREHAGPVHLLVTDVVMPGLSGPALAGQITAANPRLKILYISGYTRDALTAQGGVGSGAGFLQKPFSAQELARKVRELLDPAA
jgi:PAS domain S-box-containing protein